MAEEDEGTIGADWAMGTEGAEGAEEDEGAANLLYRVRWLGHHGNRLYGFMGLRSKMSDWTGWVTG